MPDASELLALKAQLAQERQAAEALEARLVNHGAKGTPHVFLYSFLFWSGVWRMLPATKFFFLNSCWLLSLVRKPFHKHVYRWPSSQ